MFGFWMFGGKDESRGAGVSKARDVRRHAHPAAVAPRPHVRVAPGARLTVRLRVRGAGVDQRRVAQHADQHVLDAEILHGRSTRDLGEEARPVHQRAVRIAVDEVVGEVRVEPPHVRLADRSDVLAVERLQRRLFGGHGQHLVKWADTQSQRSFRRCQMSVYRPRPWLPSGRVSSKLAWIRATSPTRWMDTSGARKLVTVWGRPMRARKPALSTKEPSGLVAR